MIRFITTVLTCEQFNYQETTRQSIAFTDIHGNDLKDTVKRLKDKKGPSSYQWENVK